MKQHEPATGDSGSICHWTLRHFADLAGETISVGGYMAVVQDLLPLVNMSKLVLVPMFTPVLAGPISTSRLHRHRWINHPGRGFFDLTIDKHEIVLESVNYRGVTRCNGECSAFG